MSIFIIFYFFGVMSLIFWSKSLINILISLELMMFGLYFGLLMNMMNDSLMFEMMLFLVIIVCEAVLGLVILMMKVYFSGKDKILSQF